MKKIINGRKYDTETAKHIGSRSEGQPGNFEYFTEDLYLKKTGRPSLEMVARVPPIREMMTVSLQVIVVSSPLPKSRRKSGWRSIAASKPMRNSLAK